MADKPPYICEPQDQSAGRPATFIFLHGYGDDAEGIPLGLAQQFQWHNKLPYLRWVFPNAPFNSESFSRAWYLPKALPSALKPRVPTDRTNDEAPADGSDPDDEEGILASVKVIDDLVRKEIDRGVEPGRIIVGGFSQGCAVSLVWGLAGEECESGKVGGVVLVAGYFPLADRIEALRSKNGFSSKPSAPIATENGDKEKLKWFYVHGSKDVLVPLRLYNQGKEELEKWVASEDIEGHVYEGMGHSIASPLLRDLLGFLTKVIPP